MSDRRQWIPVLGLLGTIAVAVYMVVQLNAQAGRLTGDFSNAAAAEVRDAQGQVLLRGQFSPVDEDDDEVGRKAPLQAAGADGTGSGEAEVEFPKDMPAHQEIEFSVRDMAPRAVLTFVVDGQVIGTSTTDDRGRAEFEVDAQR